MTLEDYAHFCGIPWPMEDDEDGMLRESLERSLGAREAAKAAYGPGGAPEWP